MTERSERGGARAWVDVRRTVTLEALEHQAAAPASLFSELVPPLFLVDGNNLLWRAAHGYPAPFPADDGRDLTPLFRFFTLLRRALGTYGLFAECIVCFDGADAWGRRLDIDASYKSNRRYDDADLSFMGWLPEIRAALAQREVPSVEIGDEEADDVIATLTHRAGDRPVRILSTDRDYFQLISSTVAVVNPKTRPAVVDAASVERRYGVGPEQWCDFRAICGDPSDGIAGVPGYGARRAAELLSGGRTLDDVIDELPAADVRRWRELIRLRTDVPLDLEPRGEQTPPLPSPTAVCVELGLVEERRPRRRRAT